MKMEISSGFLIMLFFICVCADEMQHSIFSSGLDHTNGNWRHNLTVNEGKIEDTLKELEREQAVKINSDDEAPDEKNQLSIRKLILASGFGFLAGFMGGSIVSVIVVFCVFRFSDKGTLVYDKRVVTYRAGDRLSIDEW